MQRKPARYANTMETPAPPVGPDHTLADLHALYGLSVRAYNVLSNAGLQRLSQVREFGLQFGGFGILRNCGAKTIREIEALLMAPVAVPEPNAPDARGERIANARKGAALFMEHFAAMSKRTRSVLVRHARSDNPEAVYAMLERKGIAVLTMRGIGPGTRPEVAHLLATLARAQGPPSQPQAPAVLPLSPEQRWMMRHTVPPRHATLLWTEEGHLTFLRFLVHYLQEHATRNVRVYLDHASGQPNKKALKNLAVTYALSQERVRQVLDRFNGQLDRHLAMVQDLPGAAEHYAVLLPGVPWLLVSRALCEPLNAREGTSWPPLLFAHLAQVLSKGSLVLVHWKDLLGKGPLTRSLHLNAPLLVASELVTHLTHVMREVWALYEQPRKKNEHMVLPALSPTGTAHHVACAAVLTSVLPDVLPGVTVDGATVQWPANTRMTSVELLEDLLDELNEPSRIEVLHALWKQRFPQHPTAMASIRRNVIMHPERFFSISRTSTYGLRRWEGERPALAGGTLRDIAERILEGSNTMLHIDTILAGVQRYRPTTERDNLLLNLSMETFGRFQFRPGGWVGLGGRTYPAVAPAPLRVPRILFHSRNLAPFVGKPSADLAVYLTKRSSLPLEVMARAVDDAIAEGRIHVNPEGTITSIHVPQRKKGRPSTARTKDPNKH